jgi:GNAT superfamily N-acetyltransferase
LARLELGPPELLGKDHKLSAFSSGQPALDQWLVRRALANQVSGASRTYVAVHNGAVIGYYAVVAGSIDILEAPTPVRRNMPDPIPIVLLGRLAVAEQYQGRGVGAFLLRDAFGRVVQASEVIGIAGIVVHALDEAAKAFYVHYGFTESPSHPTTLMLSMKRADA